MAPKTSEKNRSRNFFQERLPDSASAHSRTFPQTSEKQSLEGSMVCTRADSASDLLFPRPLSEFSVLLQGWVNSDSAKYSLVCAFEIPRAIWPGPVRERLQERPALRDSASGIPRAQITGLCVFAALVISRKRKNS